MQLSGCETNDLKNVPIALCEILPGNRDRVTED